MRVPTEAIDVPSCEEVQAVRKSFADEALGLLLARVLRDRREEDEGKPLDQDG